MKKSKKMKNVISGVLSAVMLTNFCTVMPISVFAKDDEINNKKVDLSEDNTAVFTPDKEGKYVVKATASDPSGNTIIKQLTITAVQPDTIAPTVTISFDKDTYFEDDDIVISVSATDQQYISQ